MNCREKRFIDYLQGDEDAANEGWPWYIRRLRAKKYDYAKIILPHDARARQRTTGKGDEQTLIDAGLDVWKLWDGVKAVNDEAGPPTDDQRQQLAELVKGLEARFDAAAKN